MGEWLSTSAEEIRRDSSFTLNQSVEVDKVADPSRERVSQLLGRIAVDRAIVELSLESSAAAAWVPQLPMCLHEEGFASSSLSTKVDTKSQTLSVITQLEPTRMSRAN